MATDIVMTDKNTMLIGNTGFVGSNLAESYAFTNMYHSKNIKDAYGKNPDLLVYAGLRAEKFLANKDPQADLETIKEAIYNIEQIAPKQLVLISTVDVYKNPVNVEEDSIIDTKDLHAYGANRYYLEQWVSKTYENALIVRLPGLYGKNLKKNFLFDYIKRIPSMLSPEKYEELSKVSTIIPQNYTLQGNGFYKYNECMENNSLLKEEFLKLGFSALNFTDSRGRFQFYNLSNLWNHIQIALKENISILNIATAPLTVREIFYKLEQKDFINEVATTIPNYDFRTKYAAMFGGSDGYLFTADEVLDDIEKFIKEQIGE
ncbi:MAG: NAD(P)-dependent oxidoreductase [Lachnospiraceae bacterium]